MSAEPGPSPSANYTNTASGNASVGNQFGFVNGNVHLYGTSPSDSPEKKLETARRLLEGNMPRPAEELLREIYGVGHMTGQVAYFWELALLSGRSFEQLNSADLGALETCSRLVDTAREDEWRLAARAVTELIGCLQRQIRSGDQYSEEFDALVKQLGELREERREEILRHLDLIIDGGLQDRLDAEYADEVRNHRMSDGRADRVRKYFESPPHEPILPPLMPPALTRSARRSAIAGAALLIPGLAGCLLMIILMNTLIALADILLLGAGGWLLAVYGHALNVGNERVAAHDRRFGTPRPRTRYTLPPQRFRKTPLHRQGLSDREDNRYRAELQRREWFDTLIVLMVSQHFGRHSPKSEKRRQEWQEKTAGYRKTLAEELQDRYVDFGCEAACLRWLVKAHARRASRNWADLEAARDRMAPTRSIQRLTNLGTISAAFGAAICMAGALRSNIVLALVFAGAIGVGGLLLRRSQVDVHLVQRDLFKAQSEAAAEQYQWEREAFEEYRRYLEDQPTDMEVARWLYYDKVYVRQLAMDACGLANRDVIAHAVLTEPHRPCDNARVVFGPQRYTRYKVLVFLLTTSGVRLVTANLNFVKGLVSDQQRMTFRYEAMVSAQIEEKGVAFDGGRRRVVLAGPNSETLRADVSTDVTFSRTFRLSLVNGESINVQIVDFARDLVLQEEDPTQVVDLALDNSGVSAALHVLETVTAEGGDWITQEHERRIL